VTLFDVWVNTIELAWLVALSWGGLHLWLRLARVERERREPGAGQGQP